MKQVFSFLLLMLLINQNLNAQIIDRAPTGNENILPVEGVGIKMKIDAITPLDRLINKLNENWEFIETGKGYWIGYTNDMFSIASRGDIIIPALINFFDTTVNKKGQLGVIYTLHLLGIQRRIAGRFTEKFVDSAARLALLNLLRNRYYTHNIIELLMRDPWQSDIPYFFRILMDEKDDEITWPIINSLKRYQIPEFPIDNKLPEPFNNLSITLKVENENVLEKDFDFSSQIKEALKKFGNKFPESIKIEKELYNENLSEYYKTKLSGNLNIHDLLSSLGIESDGFFSYMELGCKIQYFIQDNQLNFCTIRTAQRKLNDWWTSLPIEQKNKFNNNKSFKKS